MATSRGACVGHPCELPLASPGEAETSVPTGPLSGPPCEFLTSHPCPSRLLVLWGYSNPLHPEKLPGFGQAVWCPWAATRP